MISLSNILLDKMSISDVSENLEIPEIKIAIGSQNYPREIDGRGFWVINVYSLNEADENGYSLIPEKEISPFKDLLDTGSLCLIEDETTKDQIALGKLLAKYGIKHGVGNVKSPDRFYNIWIQD